MNALVHRLLLASLLAAAVLPAAMGAAGCSRVFSADALDGVVQPVIVPAAGVTESRKVDFEFAFEDARVSLSVPVETAVYAGAAGAEKTALFLNGKEPEDWVSDYYRAFIGEEHQDAFYTALLTALHQVRDERGLDSARYVELVTSMVQGMEYRIDPGDLAPKFAIETFADSYGDCDDKTLLAAGVLSRDGYDVAVLMFGPEEHVALGIKSPGLDYKGTGYAYVETTNPSLVGVPPEELSDGSTLESEPTVIRIGEGSGEYEAADQITYIQRRSQEIEAERSRLAKRIKSDNAELDSRQGTLESAKRELESRGSQATASDVQAFNARVDAYNALVAKTGEAIQRHNALVEVQKYVAANRTARPQVYKRLKSTR